MIMTIANLLIILPIITLIDYFSDIMEYISEMIDEQTFTALTVLSIGLAVTYVFAGLYYFI